MDINGRMKVKTLKSQFKDEFGLTLRVYDGRSFADDDATLASIRKGDSKGGEFTPRKNTKVGNLEDKIQEMFGIKVQIAGSDDSYLCDNDMTLQAALEEDGKKLERKQRKEARQQDTDEQVEDGGSELVNSNSAKRKFNFVGKKYWFDEISLSDLPDEFLTIKNSENKNYKDLTKFFIVEILPENIDEYENLFLSEDPIEPSDLTIDKIYFDYGDFIVVDFSGTFEAELIENISDQEINDFIEESSTFNDGLSIMFDEDEIEIDGDNEEALYPTSSEEFAVFL